MNNRLIDSHVDGVQLGIPPGAKGFKLEHGMWIYTFCPHFRLQDSVEMLLEQGRKWPNVWKSIIHWAEHGRRAMVCEAIAYWMLEQRRAARGTDDMAEGSPEREQRECRYDRALYQFPAWLSLLEGGE